MLNFGDPSIAFRIVIVVFSGLSAILMIAGTVVDEYISTRGMMKLGCQKYVMEIDLGPLGSIGDGASFRASFKDMNTLSVVIILTTSVLCLLLALGAVFNVLVLVKGRMHKAALILSSIVAFLLMATLIMANINFSGKSAATQGVAFLEALMAEKPDSIIPKFRGKRSMLDSDYGKPLWGTSYSLLAAAFSFSLMNLILHYAIHQMSKSGVSTFGAFGSSVLSWILSTVRDGCKLARIGITLFSSVMLILMVIATASDRYVVDVPSGLCGSGIRLRACGMTRIPFGDMVLLEIVLFALTCLICVLQVIAFIMCLVQWLKDKMLTVPLLAVSIASFITLLGGLVVACIHFKPVELKDTWGVSFNCLAASFALGIFRAALAVLNMVLSKRGGGFGASQSRGTSSNQPSSGGIPSQPSSGGLSK